MGQPRWWDWTKDFGTKESAGPRNILTFGFSERLRTSTDQGFGILDVPVFVFPQFPVDIRDIRG